MTLGLACDKATDYELNDRGFIPGKGKIFSSLRLTQPPIPLVPGAISPGVKRTGPEAAEVKNGGATPPSPTSSRHSA
jgi:hypothetical protein